VVGAFKLWMLLLNFIVIIMILLSPLCSSFLVITTIRTRTTRTRTRTSHHNNNNKMKNEKYYQKKKKKHLETKIMPSIFKHDGMGFITRWFEWQWHAREETDVGWFHGIMRNSAGICSLLVRHVASAFYRGLVCISKYVCVCVWVRERERKKKRDA
jgi:hypothetical protein